MRSFLIVIICFVIFIAAAYLGYKDRENTEIMFNTSSPVEEMYHRQLVVTLDSILDARFGTGCCEEDTDTINANTFRSRFSSTLSSMD